MKHRRLEKDFTSECREALHKLGFWCERAGNGASILGRRQRNQAMDDGAPDLILRCPPNAMMVAIETKNTHSDMCGCSSCSAQRRWRKRHEADGGLYFKVRTLNELMVCVQPLLWDKINRRASAELNSLAIPDWRSIERPPQPDTIPETAPGGRQEKP